MKLAKIFVFTIAIFSFVSSAQASRQVSDGFADLVENLTPAVVNISTTQTVDSDEANYEEFFSYSLPEGTPFKDLPEMLKKFYGEQNGQGDKSNPKGKLDKNNNEHKALSLGSGFIIDSSGYVVTNNHVIDKAEEITVIFSDETKAKAKIVGRDAKTDIAILKVEVNHKLPAVKWGDSQSSRVGDWVIAIGNPFGLGGSVSAGIISARARDINAGPFDDFIQTDAAINRGNSGGPLFNTKGEVIGINTAIYSPTGGSVGIGFAVPANLAHPVIDQLLKKGRVDRGWLGVKIQTVSDEIADSLGLDSASGALVLEVTKGSPADKAGILPSDVILKFDGKEVQTMHKLPRMVAETSIGRSVDVLVLRGKEKKTLKVKVAQLQEDEEVQVANKKQSGHSKKENKEQYGATVNKLGLVIANLSDTNRNKFKIKEELKGVIIIDVASGSLAEQKGLQRGDVISSINQQSVENIKTFEAIINQAKDSARKSVMLLVNRKGATEFVVLAL